MFSHRYKNLETFWCQSEKTIGEPGSSVLATGLTADKEGNEGYVKDVPSLGTFKGGLDGALNSLL